MTEKQIIEGCQAGDPSARRELYERYGSKMLGVCLRYVRDRETAHDLLHDGFITIYTKIGDYRGEGAFEGWMRRIFVNISLGYLRRQRPMLGAEAAAESRTLSDDGISALERLSAEELLGMFGQLAEGYRVILNLYAVEGYSHKEIGELLHISENTSRSQYSRARGRLQELLLRQRERERASLDGAAHEPE
ncbi:MAG: sigma-70 family RNA polymerase sigma factor [Rikenellaceae bacterium]|nr:sigma-70 family RNA polymerase sigma factor [Rikenellaceae bacterium]